MPTPYANVYDLFTSKITDYAFLNLTDTELEDIFRKYLRSAVVKFDTCKIDLQDRDEVTKQFNKDLSDTEQEILSTLMIVEWLSNKVNDVKNLKNVLTDRDFNFYSPANHLKQMMEAKRTLQLEADKLVIKYSYKDLGKQ